MGLQDIKILSKPLTVLTKTERKGLFTQQWFKTHGVHTEQPWLFVSYVHTSHETIRNGAILIQNTDKIMKTHDAAR